MYETKVEKYKKRIRVQTALNHDEGHQLMWMYCRDSTSQQTKKGNDRFAISTNF